MNFRKWFSKNKNDYNNKLPKAPRKIPMPEVKPPKEEIINKNTTFTLSDEEQKLFENFKKEHRNKCGIKYRWSITFTPTGIGNCVKVKCLKCGEEKDITDVDCW